MMDSLIAVFPDHDMGAAALDHLVESGWPASRISLRRVVAADYRGVTGETGAAHTLMHSPKMEEPSTLADDAGTVIVVVRLVEGDEPETVGSTLTRLGAETTELVEGTPPLDV